MIFFSGSGRPRISAGQKVNRANNHAWDNDCKTRFFYFWRPADPRRRPTGSERLDLGILGSCSPRAPRVHVQKSSDSPNPAVSRDSRILGFLDISRTFFFPFGLSSRNLKIRGSSDTRSSSLGNSLDPCGSPDLTSVPRESGRWIKRAWPIEPGRRSDRGPSNSLRFREAAARFGSLISFRI